MNPQDVTKIYRIEVPGIDDAISKIAKLNEQIALTKAAKQEAQKILAANPQDTDNISRQTAIIAQNEVALKKLNAEKSIAQKQSDLLIKAAKDQAIADTNTGAASLYAAGSYNALYASYKQLVNEYRNTPKTDPMFEQIRQSAQAAKVQIDDFNRTLSPDGTLIGEYKTGVLNAFKELGLTNIIKDQKAQIEAQLKSLGTQNKELAEQLKSSGKQGTEAFAGIETQLKQNIETQDKLKGSLAQINTSLGSTKSLGKEIKDSINEGFTEIFKSGLEVAGIVIGVQQAFEFLKESIKEFSESDRIAKQLQSTLKNLGREDALEVLAKQAEDLRSQFKFLHESDIQLAQQKLINFGKLTAAQIQELMPIIVNFAAMTGKTLPDAAEIITKALAGGKQGLLEYGIRLGNTATFADRLNAVMTVMKEKVDGAATAFEHSAAGGIADTKEQIRQLEEEIGQKALPILSSLLKFLNDGLGGLKDIAVDSKNTIVDTFDYVFRYQKYVQDIQNKQKAEFEQSRNENIAQEIKDKTDQYVQAIKSGNLQLDTALKSLQSKADSKTADFFSSQVFKGVLENVKGKFDNRTLGGGGVDLQEAEKQRQAAVAAIEKQAADEQAILEKKKLAGTLTEEQYQKDLFNILQTAAEKKIAILQGGSTKEIQQASQAKLQLIKDEQAFQDKMFGFAKDRIEAQKVLDTQAAQDQFNRISNDPMASPVAKAEAQITLDKKLQDIQVDYNTASDKLEKDYAKTSQKNMADRGKALKDIVEKTNVDLFNLTKEGFQHILAIETFASDFKKSIIDTTASERSLAVLNNQSLTDTQQQIELLKIKGQAAVEANQVDIDSTKKLITYYFLQYGNLVAVNKEVQTLLVNLGKYQQNAKQIAIDNAKAFAAGVNVTAGGQNTQNLLGDQLSKALGIDTATDNGAVQKKLLAEVIAGSFNTANVAMNDYFDAEKNRIDASNKLVQKRLDLELNQRKAQAQSAAEQAALDKEYAAKKEAADKDAFEKNKKLQLAQAKIALGTELANLAVIAFAPNPANIATLGTAGAIMYAIQAALAIARYAFTAQQIQSASYAQGGSFEDILGQGGVFAGRSHAQGGNRFLWRGIPVETEAREAYVINKMATQAQGMFTVSGTPKQIASAVNTIGGGRNFAPGAYMMRRMEYGGSLGEALQAPQNIAAYLGVGGGQDMQELKNMVAMTNATVMAGLEQVHTRIDQIEVVQVTNTVTTAQRKEARQKSIGTV